MDEPEAKQTANPQPPKNRNRFSWSQGFELFCSGFSFPQIAEQLGCTPNAVKHAANRMHWQAKRAKVQDKYPTLDPLNNYSPVARQMLQFQPTQIEHLEEQESKLRFVFDMTFDPEQLCMLNRELARCLEMRMEILGIPGRGSRKHQGEKQAKRGEVSAGGQSAQITDVRAVVTPTSE